MTREQRAFRDSIAIVTGGGSGIGKAVCNALGANGAKVAVVDINTEAAEATAHSIASAGGEARAYTVDVRDADAVERLVDEVVKDKGRVDYMFNNAGIAIAGEERDVSLSDWRKVLDVNLFGVIHGVRAVYPRMVQQASGHIVNTASVAGLVPTAFEISYAASKHAVVGLSTGLRAEGAALGVKVSVVCPGFIDTPILTQSEVRGTWNDKAVTALMPKPTAPDDCAKAILSGVAKNHGIIVVTGHAKFIWWAHRMSPTFADRMARAIVGRVRAKNHTATERKVGALG